ncbi:MAG TPA: metallophosphoesterase [Trueperaceae bacterium]|nr:metallophosphoesterase [Trueperaceae bacterium]
MRLYAIADPHLSRAEPKPMTIFGPGWDGHPDAFFDGWRSVVGEDDVVLVPGDLSWAMRLEDALLDLEDIAELPGRKVILRGNHDYWWPSISKLRRTLPEGMYAVQNDAVEVDGVVVAGSRGWVCPGSRGFSDQDEKIYRREAERLALSVRAAERLSGRYRVVMLHFPPTNVRLQPSAFTDLIRGFAPDALVFGHVHGDNEGVLERLDGIAVHFVAADAIGFVPRLVHDFGAVDAAEPAAVSARGLG